MFNQHFDPMSRKRLETRFFGHASLDIERLSARSHLAAGDSRL